MLTKNYAKFLLALREAEQSQLRALYYKQRIETGVWKERIGTVFKLTPVRGTNTPLADQEVLKSEIETMHRHINNAEKHLEHAKMLVSLEDFQS